MPTIARLCVHAKNTKMIRNRHDSSSQAPYCQWEENTTQTNHTNKFKCSTTVVGTTIELWRELFPACNQSCFFLHWEELGLNSAYKTRTPF